jgi:hypothetical protein
MTALGIILRIYRDLISKKEKQGIPIDLMQRAIVGTVQDDPFDRWIGNEITLSLGKSFQVFPSGSLTTPDLVIRDKKSGVIIGLEIKKLIQKPNGSDSRGLTMDYNSCLPCGSALVKVGLDTIIVPCFYLFGLLNQASTHIVTLILMDGDFINYDFDLHKESKYANFTEYGHGPYGEGSVRHRRMYTYPNPLNSKIADFYHRNILVAKKIEFDQLKETVDVSAQIIRKDRYGNSFFYYLLDEITKSREDSKRTLIDLFEQCKQRTPKERTAATASIPPLTV